MCGSLVELIIWLMCAWWLVAQVFAPDFAALTGMLESMRRYCVALITTVSPDAGRYNRQAQTSESVRASQANVNTQHSSAADYA